MTKGIYEKSNQVVRINEKHWEPLGALDWIKLIECICFPHERIQDIEVGSWIKSRFSTSVVIEWTENGTPYKPTAWLADGFQDVPYLGFRNIKTYCSMSSFRINACDHRRPNYFWMWCMPCSTVKFTYRNWIDRPTYIAKCLFSLVANLSRMPPDVANCSWC